MMLDDVEDDVRWKSNFVQRHPASCNFVHFNMAAKRAQHVGFNDDVALTPRICLAGARNTRRGDLN